MKFNFAIRWLTDAGNNEELDPRLLKLLKEIRDGGSLRQAAEVSGVSYRFAWDLFRLWQSRFGKPLALFERGRGAKLTELGEKLLSVQQKLAGRLHTELEQLGEELNGELAAFLDTTTSEKRIRIHASHDLAISYFSELCHLSTVFKNDFEVRGSLEGLRQLATGQCEVAGFHFPRDELSESLQTQYRTWLDPNKMRLLQVAIRQQGLMTQAKNPRHIKGLADLGRRSLRFINRQKESGTRIIFDELLRYANIDKENIKGYYNEEFTHLAVAAMLASGAADAGFGIKAAALKFGLHFIPLVEENYVLAVSNNVSDVVFNQIQVLLRSGEFKKKIKSLPGYRGINTGKVLSIEKLMLGE